MLVLAIIVVFSASEVFGMGKSDGSKDDVKKAVSEPVAPVVEAAPKAVKVEAPKAVEVAEPVEDKVLVTVNGVKIMQSDIDEEVIPQKSRMMAAGRPVPDSMVKQMEQRIISMLVEKRAVEDEIAAQGIVITDEQIQVEAEVVAGQRGMSVEEFQKAMLERGGVSKEDFESRLRMGLGFKALMDKAVVDGIGVTEEEARAYYDENAKQYTREAQAKASHILVDTRGKDEAGKAAAKEEADGLLKQVRDGGDFAELAKAHSSCPSSAKGGDLGYFEKGRMVPEFSEAAFSMKVGDVSDVVETQFGYHIIKLTDMKEAGVSAFEDEKDNIMEMLKVGKEREFGQAYVERIKAEANIVWSEGVEPAM